MEMTAAPLRPDMDIEEDIAQLIRSYAPLQASRNYFTYKSENGRVTLVGNVRSPQARRMLVDSVSRVPGVSGIDESDFYDDDRVTGSIGVLLPSGVFATVHGGVVALTGALPADASKDDLVQSVAAVSGVRRVGAAFGQSDHTPSL